MRFGLGQQHSRIVKLLPRQNLRSGYFFQPFHAPLAQLHDLLGPGLAQPCAIEIIVQRQSLLRPDADVDPTEKLPIANLPPGDRPVAIVGRAQDAGGRRANFDRGVRIGHDLAVHDCRGTPLDRFRRRRSQGVTGNALGVQNDDAVAGPPGRLQFVLLRLAGPLCFGSFMDAINDEQQRRRKPQGDRPFQQMDQTALQTHGCFLRTKCLGAGCPLAAPQF